MTTELKATIELKSTTELGAENTELERFIMQWSGRKVINGQSFDDIFQLDGIPLGWFYKKLLLFYFTPKKLNMSHSIESRKTINFNTKIKLSLYAKLLEELIYLNESKKIRYFRKKSWKNRFEEQKQKKGQVLFLTYPHHISSEGEVFRVQTVIEQIKKDKKLADFILVADLLSKKVDTSGRFSNFPNIYKYLYQQILDKAEIVSKKLYAQWRSLDSQLKENFFKMGEMSLWPYLKYPLKFYFSKNFFYLLVLYYELCQKIIKVENIKSIVLSSANSLVERCIVAAAKKNNVHSFVVQHGIGLGRLIDNTCPLNFTVFGEHHFKKLVRNGALPEYVHVTGPVIFDQAYKFVGPKEKKSRNVVFATSPMVEDGTCKKDVYFSKIKMILEHIAGIAGTKIIIKLHPREKHLHYYQEIVQQSNLKNVHFFNNNSSRDDFYRTVQECDSFVHFCSTAALEAMIIDRPIVSINILNVPYPPQISWLEDSTINITCQDDIKSAVIRSFDDEEEMKKKRKVSVEKFCGQIDSQASARVAELIYQKAGLVER